MASTNEAVYVYCVVRAAHRPQPPLAVTLPDAGPVELSSIDRSLVLVTSRVPLEVYGPSRLEPRLHDLEWVSEVAVAHEAVVAHFARRRACTVVPMKIFMMFSTIEKALAAVRRRRATLARAMNRIAGCDEWGVRITRAPSKVTGVASFSSGTAFLNARKDARHAVRTAQLTAQAAADSAFTRLRRFSAAARRRDTRSPQGTNPPILDAAFLVKGSARAGFQAEAKRLAAACAAAGATMAITGPWPAYSFVQATGSRS
jgi:hypothetical protein